MIFEMLHLKEVMVVVITELILKTKIKIIDMIKTVCTHLVVGHILTILAPFMYLLVSFVGLNR